MIQGIVGVEETLSNIMEALETEGYEVVTLNKANLDTVDAIVVSGMDNNLMNIQDLEANVPVINAAGKSADEILAELDRL